MTTKPVMTAKQRLDAAPVSRTLNGAQQLDIIMLLKEHARAAAQRVTLRGNCDEAAAKHALKKLMECITADTVWNERSQPLTEAISEAYDLLCAK